MSKPTHEELLNALRLGKLAVDELFKELGKKECGDWGIINTGLIAMTKAIKASGGEQ